MPPEPRPERPRRASPAAAPGDCCDACLRRTALLALLAPHVEHARRSRSLGSLLSLPDDALVAAIAGRRRPWFEAAITRFDPDHARAAATRAGLTQLCCHAPAYPARLLESGEAPAVLHVAGDVAALPVGTEPVVAVVGARRATPYGLEVARALGRGLAAAGIPVVSGMALGIDAAAHAGALEVGGPTIAVLAGGADRAYPRSKTALHRRIVTSSGCCVASEMPPGFVPFRWGFPARNRIIAALADATVVVEAAERSGSLITADMAQELGRLVAAVPGAVTNPMAVGVNALLRDGAELVRDAQDLLDALLGAGVRAVPRGPDPATLPPPLRALLDRLGSRPATSSALLSAGEEADDVVAGLAELELLGYARRVPGGAYVRAAG